MADGQEFNQTARVTYQFAGLEYWIDVNEYGAAFVKCFEGRGTRWEHQVKPGKTFEYHPRFFPRDIADDWTKRINAAIVDLRGLVGA